MYGTLLFSEPRLVPFVPPATAGAGEPAEVWQGQVPPASILGLTGADRWKT